MRTTERKELEGSDVPPLGRPSMVGDGLSSPPPYLAGFGADEIASSTDDVQRANCGLSAKNSMSALSHTPTPKW